MKTPWITALVLLVAACSPAAPAPVDADLQPPLPLALSVTFPDLTERLEWTISFPLGWVSEAVTPSGLGGRLVKEGPVGLTSASLTFTTLTGAYTPRTVLAVLSDALGRNGYTDVTIGAVDGLPPPLPGTSAAAVYLTARHAGTPVQAAWVVNTLDITQYSNWPITALQLWAIEFPAGHAREKLRTLLAILGSARLNDTGVPVGETWYGKIAEKWMRELGRHEPPAL